MSRAFRQRPTGIHRIRRLLKPVGISLIRYFVAIWREFESSIITLRPTPNSRRSKVNRRWIRTRPLANPHVDDHRRQLAMDVMLALDDAKITYFAIPDRPRFPRRIAVAQSQQTSVTTALAESLPAHVVAGHMRITRFGAQVGALQPLRRLQPSSAPILRVLDPCHDAESSFVLGFNAAVEIEFWNDQEPELIAPRANPYCRTLQPEAQVSVLAPWKSFHYKTIELMLHPTVTMPMFPIDVVYTWVDGSDPSWLRKRAAALNPEASETFTEEADATARFADHEELRFSLRSLELYADWVNHIWIVTDGQQPAWLDTTNERVTVVDHKEIWSPDGVLPTFNSHAIEAHLHRIEGLSEKFLYLNDDMIFGRRVNPSMFFHGNGLSKVFMSQSQLSTGEIKSGDIASDTAGRNIRQIFIDQFGSSVSHKLYHAPLALQRSIGYELEQKFPEQHAQTAASQFRRITDLTFSGSFHIYYAIQTARAVPASITYRYVNMSAPQTEQFYWRNGTYDTICLNDISETEQSQRNHQHLHSVLAQAFPSRSRFERADVPL